MVATVTRRDGVDWSDMHDCWWAHYNAVYMAYEEIMRNVWMRKCPVCGEVLGKHKPDDVVTCLKCGWQWAHRYVS